MKNLKILFLTVFLYTNTFGAAHSLTVCTPNDSLYYSNVVKLIHDYKALKSQYINKEAYLDSLIVYIDAVEIKLKKTREYLSTRTKESDRCRNLYKLVSKALEESISDNIKLEKKLKRTRKIAVGFTALGILGGVLIAVLI